MNGESRKKGGFPEIEARFKENLAKVFERANNPQNQGGTDLGGHLGKREKIKEVGKRTKNGR